MKARDHEYVYSGTPLEIVTELRRGDFSKPKTTDAYLNRMAKEFKLDIAGKGVDARCEAFLQQAFAKNILTPVFDPLCVDGFSIRILRKLRGISRDRLAQLIGVVPMTLHRWENLGKLPTKPKDIEALKRELFDVAIASGNEQRVKPIIELEEVPELIVTGERLLKAPTRSDIRVTPGMLLKFDKRVDGAPEESKSNKRNDALEGTLWIWQRGATEHLLMQRMWQQSVHRVHAVFWSHNLAWIVMQTIQQQRLVVDDSDELYVSRIRAYTGFRGAGILPLPEWNKPKKGSR